MSILKDAWDVGKDIYGMATGNAEADKQRQIDNANINIQQQNANRELQKFNWDRQAQQTTWQREDNATQRKVEDLKKAGLNPVLAVSNASPTSAPMNITAPRREAIEGKSRIPNSAKNYLEMTQQRQNIAQTHAQLNILDKQAQKLESEKIGVDKDNQLKDFDIKAGQLVSTIGKGSGAFSSVLQALIPLIKVFTTK
ncbi:MAG: DNA pilot protein [Arizlama microvirus]|nr:MAG: DNA pilot protein [Arizlama microvirus]